MKAPQVRQAAIVCVEGAGYKCPCGYSGSCHPDLLLLKPIHFIFHSPHLGNNSHHISENNSRVRAEEKSIKQKCGAENPGDTPYYKSHDRLCQE